MKDLAKIATYYKQMELAGFTPRGDYTGEGEEYFTQDAADGTRLVSIHVLPVGHVWINDLINFRDYLRNHPNESAKYSEAKRSMYTKNKKDYNAYYRGKLQLIQEIRQKAANWKASKN